MIKKQKGKGFHSTSSETHDYIPLPQRQRVILADKISGWGSLECFGQIFPAL